ncbi:MAG TPA: DNA polymerase Y family protein [bacterium]
MLWLGIHLPRFSAEVVGDAAAMSAALARLAGWAGRFTPVVSPVPPRELLLEVAGSLRLFGGPDRLAARVVEGLRDLGYTAAAALAPPPLAATLLARARPGTLLTQRGTLERELGPVPVSALDVAPETLAALRGIGAGTLGDCLRLPRAGLARRIGTDLLRVLDRALGRIPDPREPFVLPPRYEGCLVLPAAVASVEPLLFAARRLLLELEGYLEARGGGAVALAWTLRHHGGHGTRVEVGLAAPAREPGRLLKLLRERLERTRLAGPVEVVELAVEQILPLVPANLDLWQARAAQSGQAWPELLDRLRARLGAAAVQGLRPAADHRPERAFVRTEPSLGEQPAPSPAPGPRPLWLLSAPMALPARRLTLVAGPERIESGWWDGADVQRDYFVAEDRGGLRLWVFRERGGERHWFLHGIFG